MSMVNLCKDEWWSCISGSVWFLSFFVSSFNVLNSFFFLAWLKLLLQFRVLKYYFIIPTFFRCYFWQFIKYTCRTEASVFDIF